MAGHYHRFASIFQKIRAVRSGPSRRLVARVKVTVLLFCLIACRTPTVRGDAENDSCVFEFRCEFWMPISPGRVDGLMATDGRRQRIAIYWMEPAMFREAPSFVRYCDLIFDGGMVHYWIQGMSQPGAFVLPGGEQDPLLPVQKSAESILRSALAIAGRVRCPDDETDASLEVTTFFECSRGLDQFQHRVSSDDADQNQSLGGTEPGVQLLNALPFGREYSKQTRDDGSTVWRVQKTANGLPVATVTVHRVCESGHHGACGAFDEQTLGRWPLVPEAYRSYWSFDRELRHVIASSKDPASGRNLYEKVTSYLSQENMSPEVSRAMDRLRFQAALLTADSNCVWQSAQAAVAGLCADEMITSTQCLLDLGSMSSRIAKQYPERIEEQLRPLVVKVVRHVDKDTSIRMDRLMEDITRNGWFIYGELLLAEMRRTRLMEDRDIDLWATKLQASRLAKGVGASDSSDEPPSVRQYMSRLDAPPPKGVMDWNDIRSTLNEGLAKRYASEQAEAKREMVENVIRLIRLIAGEGPFCGDSEKLIPALDRFSANCIRANNGEGSFESVLATFLALSFCDTSTPEDHEQLFSQLRNCSRMLQSRINDRLASHQLTSLVAPQDVEREFQKCERLFQQYVDDPLYAPFKFPWTADEARTLDGRLSLRLSQLEPVFEEASLKVRHGGPSEELKDKVMREISVVAQQLLAQPAFLRMPQYPGIRCQYLDEYGLSVVIRGPLYQQSHRPAERFKVMRYFHVGYPLQAVVERERELARQEQLQEQTR